MNDDFDELDRALFALPLEAPPPGLVLVVEDDAQIVRVLQLELEHEGYEVDVARDGLAGLEKALKEPDLVILDLMLPKMDGIEVCTRDARQEPRADHHADRQGSHSGPRQRARRRRRRLPHQAVFDRRAAGARARSLRERTRRVERLSNTATSSRWIATATKCTAPAKAIALTAKEYALLEYLLLHRNKVHTRDELFNGVWGSDFLGDSNLIDVYIRYLRGKIDDGFDDKLITTVRGVGYTLATLTPREVSGRCAGGSRRFTRCCWSASSRRSRSCSPFELRSILLDEARAKVDSVGTDIAQLVRGQSALSASATRSRSKKP
jgi:two-component system response regulator ArlR